MSKTVIAPFKRINRKIYGYALPDVPSHVGLVKVGQTEQDNPRKRVEQQTGTVGVNYEYLFHRNAIRNDYELFRDTDLHAYYRMRGIERAVLNNKATEWFNFGDLSLAEQMADDYINSDYTAVQIGDKYDYILRPEQEAAVKQTLAYWADPVHGSEFLWNAKPRFGKTLTCYDFMRRINAQNVLIVTNRPAIANSWFDDFQKFIAWQEPGMKFVSETDALSKRNPMSRKDFIASLQSIRDAGEEPRCLAFISLQDLKGAKIAGGDFDKLEWVFGMDWDLLIIDEAHEGIDTQRTDRAFESIQKKKFTLHLSGTPFKAIANQKFHSEQIYNWSYLDEQLAKTTWDDSHEGTNPYASLPTLNLFTYQMSEIIQEELAKGIQLDDETNLDYAFNLNEFFSTDENGNFVYENEVKRFLDRLHTGKYPFADEQYKKQLNHTFWLLNRVDSAKAMEVLLKNHPFFKDYTVVLAAGDGRSFEEEQTMDELETTAMMGVWNKRSFDRVREAIASNEKTITLSVGQLTTGVTVPEWTAIF
ncbi:MAG TPA: DEAD/DEAH box helicase family protein, partial [Anaerolineaceae bacterium]|nr:DEAD/DEAH box helicase family protein [Anaerolineaceae bacterium]